MILTNFAPKRAEMFVAERLCYPEVSCNPDLSSHITFDASSTRLKTWLLETILKNEIGTKAQ